jgi:hypothetical protein
MATGSLPEARAIPTSPMPDAPEPKDWLPCRVRAIQFSLPPEMAKDGETPKNASSHRVFHDDARSIIVAMPEAIAESVEFFQDDLKMPPQGQGLSLPRLRAAWCQASSRDFRWTMSPAEVRWHAWCVAMNGLFRPQADGWAETTFTTEMDGILFISEDHRHASFVWQANNYPIDGYMHFKDASAEPDLAWVRSVCRSVRVYEESHSATKSSDPMLNK